LAQSVRPGDLVIDATIGNGHDTLYLAQIAGPEGRVIGFDVQPVALARTHQRLESHGLGRTVILHQQGHETLLECIAEQDIGQVAAVVFNLGYLPRGDKTLTTRPKTTRAALTAAWSALRPGGLISLLAYVGHRGGAEELATVEACLPALAADQGGRILRQTGHTPVSPVLLIAHRAESRAP
jgi:predicted methyltransferase